MNAYPKPIRKLIDEFTKFPSIGPKTAERLAIFVTKLPFQQVQDIADALLRAKTNVTFCRICNNFSESEICEICREVKRDKSSICIIEEPCDAKAIESSGAFHGTYHILWGRIAPLDGMGPDNLRIKNLLSRIKENSVNEIIIATGASAEGEATAIYLMDYLKASGVKVTRIACGLPVGGDLEYADCATIFKALEGRRQIT